MNIQERLAVFFHRLEAAPPANNADEALRLVCRLIEAVEDEFCPVPREEPPPVLRFTGRMYAPRQDRIHRLKGGGWVAEARRHRIICYPDGAIRIENTPEGTLLCVKPGKKR